VAGGAPLYLSNWAAIGGPQPSVRVDQWDIDNTANPAAHLNPRPADGTFLNTSTGHVYRVAGGAPFAVSSWGLFGGVQPFVTIDQWDLSNVANPAAHLNAVPSDGTVVQGLPSRSYWIFSAGLREPIGALATAVVVDDYGVAAFSQHKSSPGQPTANGNVEAAKEHGPAQLTRRQRLAKALKSCRHVRNHHKRHLCEAKARRRYR